MYILQKESLSINSLRFVCIIFLVLLHTRTGHLVNDSIRTNVDIIQNLLSIPFLQILFILSSYLFFIGINCRGGYSWDVYNKKLKRRISSLLIPYLLWGLLSIFYQHIVKHRPLPVGFQWITWFWEVEGGHPIGMALWYIKSLIIFSILSPLYFMVVKVFRHFTIVIVLLLSAFNFPIDYPWFNVYLLLGSYIALNKYSLLSIAHLFDWRMCLIVFMALKFIVAFFDIVPIYEWVGILCISCVLLCLFSRHPLPSSLCGTSSFVYFSHPYFTGIRNFLMTPKMQDSIVYALGMWMLTAVCVFTICWILFYLLKKFFPKVLGILSGGRV